MSPLNTRIEQAEKVISKYINESGFLKEILELLGIDDTEIGLQTLSVTTFEEFSSQFNSETFPAPRLRLAWNILTEKQEEKTETTSVTNISNIIEAIKPIGQWGDYELLQQYSRDCNSQIEEELAKRAKGRYCITFNEDQTVDVENSLYMLRKARHQETPATFLFDNELKKAYRINEFPLEVFYECPIHSKILLVDGYCEECAKKWDVTENENNIFIRLITENEKVDIRTYKNASFEILKENFPKTWLKFVELREEDRLPSLKRKISKTYQGDPFRVISSHNNY
jgi:hypothetical protein